VGVDVEAIAELQAEVTRRLASMGLGTSKLCRPHVNMVILLHLDQCDGKMTRVSSLFDQIMA
jgi:hypothetical protein